MIRKARISHFYQSGLVMPFALALSVGLAGCQSADPKTSSIIAEEEVAAIVPTANNTASTPLESETSTQEAPVTANPADPSDNPVLPMAETAISDPTEETATEYALGIMQPTRVKASAGSIFSTIAPDSAAEDSYPQQASANPLVQPVKISLFSAGPVSADPDMIIAPETAPGSTSDMSETVLNTAGPDDDVGIVVLNRQSDEERRIIAEKNDPERNAQPKMRAMEPDAQAAPAIDQAENKEPAKKKWSLKDMFGDLGKNAGKVRPVSSQ